MKQLYLLIYLCAFAGLGSLYGQAGTSIQLEYEDEVGRPLIGNLEFGGDAGNSTYYYTDNSAGVYVYWHGSPGRWTIENLYTGEDYFESFAATGTNPPDLASASWQAVKTGYTLTRFDGPGTKFTPIPLEIEITALSEVGCHSAANGSMTASVTGGRTPYSYAWSNGESTSTTSDVSNTIFDLSAGTYSVTVTDAAGTTATTSAAISQPVLLSARITSLTNVACFGGSSGAAAASGTGGTPSYSYAWSNGATTRTASNLSAGTYTVTVTDSHGCTGVTSATVTEPPLLVAASRVDANVTCNGGTDGAVTALASGGTPPYTYEWSNSVTTAEMIGLSAGAYILTIMDAKGCTSTASATVIEPPALVVSPVSQTNIACNGNSTGAAAVTASGGVTPYTYLWSNGATTTDISAVAAGSYVITVTDANGCSNTADFLLTEPTVLSATAGVGANVSCNGGADGSLTARGSGGTAPYTYRWDNSATTASIADLTAGTYRVTVTDANDCVATTTATITEPTLLIVSAAEQTNIACNGNSTGAAAVTAAGGTAPYTYLWSNMATTSGITGIQAGDYTVTVTDANGCTGTTDFTITEPTVLTVAGQLDAKVGCNGAADGVASARVTGGTAPYAYLWSNGATTASISELAAGSYAVTITDGNGCTEQASVTVTEPVALSVTLAAQTNITCNGNNTGTATVRATNGTAPYTYLWSNGATAATATDLEAGDYTVTVTDANGCTDFASATLTEPTALTATGTVDANAGCYGSAEGAATAAVSGGLAPYSYAWSNGATTSGMTGLIAGTYALTATDANGCTALTTVSITEAPEIALTAASSEDSGAGDGMATVAAAGGVAPYTYVWSTPDAPTTDTITDLSAGQYEVFVTDADGCTVSAAVTVSRRVLPGEACAEAINIDSLFGGVRDLALSSDTLANAEYASDTVFMDDQPLCFSEGDTLYHPVYFQFTGDGETYRIRTTGVADTRGAVLSGSCGEFTRLVCNEDEADGNTNLMVELSTEVGVTYTLLVDGASAVGVEYAVEVTQITTTSITPIQQTAIALYPNPTSGWITLAGVTVRQVDVFDGFGRRVATYAQPGTELDLQQLPTGVYYLRITDERQDVYSARVVRQ